MKFLFCILALLGATVLGRVEHKALLALRANEPEKTDRTILIDKMISSLRYHIAKRLGIPETAEGENPSAKKILEKDTFVAHSGTASTLYGCRGYAMADFNDVDLWWLDIKKQLPTYAEKFVPLNEYLNAVKPLTCKWEYPKEEEIQIPGLTDKGYCEGQVDVKQQSATACTDAGNPKKDQLYCPSLMRGNDKEQLEVDIWDGLMPNYMGMSFKAFNYKSLTSEIKSSDGKNAIKTLGPLGTLTFKLLLLVGRKKDQKESDYKDIGCLCKGLEAQIDKIPEAQIDKIPDVATKAKLDIKAKLKKVVDFACGNTYVGTLPKEYIGDKENEWWQEFVVKRATNDAIPTADMKDFEQVEEVQDPEWELKASEAVKEAVKAINNAVPSPVTGKLPLLDEVVAGGVPTKKAPESQSPSAGGLAPIPEEE